ncbi:hypothetical protein C8R44DRAFT_852526 [Mycena epipterygia]|nr:hypothetical protein C8R44DRAFT_852526 [Mycena epipterygia]
MHQELREKMEGFQGISFVPQCQMTRWWTQPWNTLMVDTTLEHFILGGIPHPREYTKTRILKNGPEMIKKKPSVRVVDIMLSSRARIGIKTEQIPCTTAAGVAGHLAIHRVQRHGIQRSVIIWYKRDFKNKALEERQANYNTESSAARTKQRQIGSS